jgi:hypothetical protein
VLFSTTGVNVFKRDIFARGTGFGSYSNTRGSRKEVVSRNCRCCEAIYMDV